MAGIGFVLRKLVQRDTLTGVMQGYFHAMLASSGPWLLTVAALSGIYLLSAQTVDVAAMTQFRTVILYNFCFSLVLSSPISMLATRNLSDRIFQKDIGAAPGMLLGALVLLFLCLSPIGVAFYFFVADLPFSLSVQAIVNFLLISAVWVTMSFVTALKFYAAITYSFVFGLIVAVVSAGGLSMHYGATGMLVGFNCGFILILASILAVVFVEYPRECRDLFGVVRYAKQYSSLALGALLGTMAVWTDKWVMWFAPEAQNFHHGMPNFALYDSSMFIAYMTIIPALAMFLVSQETRFYDVYLRFFGSIQGEGSYRAIQNEHNQLMENLVWSGRNILILQTSIVIVALAMAPRILEAFNMNFLGLAIFRIGVLGAAFQVMTLFITVFLAYFDDRRGILLINGLFLATNLGFSLISRSMGLPYYGNGYFASALLSFVVASIVVERYVRHLPFHCFIDNNSSVVK